MTTYTKNLTQRMRHGSRELQQSSAFAAEGHSALAAAIGASAANQVVTFACTVLDLEFLFMLADQDLLIEWNDNVGAQGSIYLKADKPLVWDNSAMYGSGGVTLITNGKVWTGATGTTEPTGWALLSAAGTEGYSVTAGVLTMTDPARAIQLEQEVTVISGRRYRVRMTGVAGTGPQDLEIGTTTGAADLGSQSLTAGGDFEIEFTASGTSAFVHFITDAAGDTLIVNDIVLEEVVRPLGLVDITALYVTNLAGVATTLNIDTIQDVTP